MKITVSGVFILGTLITSGAAGQVPSLSASEIVAWASDDYELRHKAIASLAKLTSEAPNSPRADSVATGLIANLRDSHRTGVARLRMLNLLSGLASDGSIAATEGLFLFAAELEPTTRAYAVQLLNVLPDTARVMAAWRLAAADQDAEVASKAVEMLAYSGPGGIAELQELIDRGVLRNPAARGWARDLIHVMKRRPQ